MKHPWGDPREPPEHHSPSEGPWMCCVDEAEHTESSPVIYGLSYRTAHTEPPQTHSTTLGQPGKGGGSPRRRQQQGPGPSSQAENDPELGRQSSFNSPDQPFSISIAAAGEVPTAVPTNHWVFLEGVGEVVPPGLPLHTAVSQGSSSNANNNRHKAPSRPEQNPQGRF